MLNSLQILLFANLNKIILWFLSSVIVPFLKRQVHKTENQIDDDLVEWLDKVVTMLETKI